MTAQEGKALLFRLKEIKDVLGGPIKVRSIMEHGFSFIPDCMTVPDAFCKLYNSTIQYNTLRLCETPAHQYWLEIMFTEIPLRKTLYWNGKKFKEYSK
jgi:hypothetical protein